MRSTRTTVSLLLLVGMPALQWSHAQSLVLSDLRAYNCEEVEQGHVLSQSIIGGWYADGWGALQNFVEAHKWLNLAAAAGDAAAAENPDELARWTTLAQIAAGESDTAGRCA